MVNEPQQDPGHTPTQPESHHPAQSHQHRHRETHTHLEALSVPLQHAMQDTVHAIADVALAPVDEVLGRSLWLRWALVAHLLSTVAATAIAFLAPFEDWQLYLWVGLLTAVLIGNFQRWGPAASWLRRIWTTIAALLVVLVWMLLLIDRAVAGAWGWRQRKEALSPDASELFWIPVALLALTFVMLTIHGALAPRRSKLWRHAVPPVKEPPTQDEGGQLP